MTPQQVQQLAQDLEQDVQRHEGALHMQMAMNDQVNNRLTALERLAAVFEPWRTSVNDRFDMVFEHLNRVQPPLISSWLCVLAGLVAGVIAGVWNYNYHNIASAPETNKIAEGITERRWIEVATGSWPTAILCGIAVFAIVAGFLGLWTHRVRQHRNNPPPPNQANQNQQQANQNQQPQQGGNQPTQQQPVPANAGGGNGP